VRSGNFNLTISAGTFRNAGHEGNWWSSRGADNVWGSAGLGGYNLNFNATGVNPSNGPTNRWIGFPLRCLFSPQRVPIFYLGKQIWLCYNYDTGY
jgi:hypothetical protein